MTQKDNLQKNRSGASIRKILLLVIAAVAAGCIIFGLLRGEAPVILTKAVNICLECIGLGR